MATFYVDIPKIEQEETTKTACLDLDENSNNDVEVGLDATSNNDVKVNIAIVGKAGSGRSSFVKAILGLQENDKNAARTGVPAKTTSTVKEATSYCHPEYPNINFSILPSMDRNTFPSFKPFLESVQIENFDAFLILTADDFTKRHLIFARLIKSSTKPLLLIRTKIDNEDHAEGVNEEKMLTEMKTKFAENFKDLAEKNETYLISNHHREKWDFEKLTEAIAGALSSPKNKCFSKMLNAQALAAMDKKFEDFLKEVKEREKDVKKIFPSAAEIKNLFVGSGIVGVQRMMNANLMRWKEVVINLAILGNSGAGKSSFINAIRDVHDGDKKAAKTGVTETTRVPTSFEHPTNSNIRFWDLPGIGTPSFPDLQTFCEKVGFDKYDTYLIICSSRFTENDRILAEKVKSAKKSFFFVRTQIDRSVEAEERKGINEKETLEKISNDCAQNLKGFDKKRIFLVSSWHTKKWDFDRLKEEILKDLPSKQKESLALSMSSNSKYLVREKINILKGRVWMAATASVASKIALGPFALYVDGKLIKNRVEFYSSQLSFPKSGSSEFGKLSEGLRRRVKKFQPDPNEDLLKWLKSFDPNNKFNIRKRMKMIITKNPFRFVSNFLNQILDEMEGAALAILEEAAKRA